MGFFDSGSSSSTTEEHKLQEPQFQDLLAQAETFAGAGAPDMQASTDLLNQTSQAQQANAAALPGQIAPAQQASQFALTDAINPASNPALQEYIQLANDQLTQQYQQQVAPALRNSNVQAGNVGSSRAGIAEGIARQGLVDAQGRQTAAITSQGYGQGLQAMMQALGLAPQTAGLGAMEGNALATAANSQGAADTNQYNADAGNLQIYRDLISGDMGGTSTTTTSGPETSMFQNLLAAGATGASIYSAIPTGGASLGVAPPMGIAAPGVTGGAPMTGGSLDNVYGYTGL